ncbi:MCE family protein [Mycolicibacterium holsaticum]|uniref:MCE family protein n=1 Tax=Mycolicibacterium holsaticum TaxID=152142 RepID=UPI001C7D4BA9|nr:MCE family protein [Mycolicibacterium holsaticum]MDA4108190.1 MCE-family protein MCE3A [Mycolicibacterium holsaticum DSM 44478 = JCM 12374]QZA14405.1 MCE family protein [Mycolicibacterium holsaticum DSM 44478 = JCM 12374]UNC08145.1 MCE family protein [Mycolicibacterium holsaticum DSM 44478 = JCM 12374]
MPPRSRGQRLGNRWWPLILLAIIALLACATAASFTGALRSYVPVTLTSDRSGLVLETGAKVKLRGVNVGRVAEIHGDAGQARLELEIDPDQIRFIPANVAAKIDVTTVFGAKFVDLVYPTQPSPQRLSAGAVLRSANVTTEVNTVFENLVDVLDMVDPLKLNAVLTAVADAMRGRGQRIGAATTSLQEVLTALNARTDTIRADLRSVTDVGEIYSSVADDIVAILNAASTTATTVTDHRNALDALLLNAVGLTTAGTNLLASAKDDLVTAVDTLDSTTSLVNFYGPTYTCMLQGADWILDKSGHMFGGDGRTFVVDVTLLPGNDPYAYPENLPVVAAKGGPGGKPGCGSLPDATKNFPVRQLITDTGWGRGLDIRPNPGIGHPCWANYFPVTRAVPQEPSIRQCLPGPAPGPQPPWAPPYGAALYGPGGVPLWPGVSPAAPNPAGTP